MLPNIENLDNLILNADNPSDKTKTFGLMLDQSGIGGMVDDATALHQDIYLKLNVEADQYIIYPYTYGLTTIDLIGKPTYYVMAVLPERIKSALMDDNRIVGVSDFEFETLGKKLHVTFVVNTIYGNLTEETVVDL